eukprot:TRINITY_DN5479_c1_g1_i1.p1 TRINITY_DN5479_c1_g1~~TRINITY_DN5479_c1_g1_i1.p1  ORF type:complete len:933 (+),score=268.54 TRINITY_DN5479_c1_g1_i1:56-2854(+)
MDLFVGVGMEEFQAQARASAQQASFYNTELDFRLDTGMLMDRFFPVGDGSSALRDPCGGSLLHWVMLLGSGQVERRSEPHRRVAKYIIEHAPKAVLNLAYDRALPQVVEEDEEQPGTWRPRGQAVQYPYSYHWYDGQTALHIAVAKGDAELVKLLIGRRVNYRKRAYGSFFAPGPGKHCYFGEYALSFAASCGLDVIVKMLLAAYPDAIGLYDTHGNTAFHMAILHRRFGTYKLLVELSEKSYQDVANLHGAMGFTPLTMAACIAPPGEGDDQVEKMSVFQVIQDRDDGSDSSDSEDPDGDPSVPLFRKVLDTTRDTAWEFATVAMNSCPLEQIDTLALRANVPAASIVPDLPSQARKGSHRAGPSPKHTASPEPRLVIVKQRSPTAAADEPVEEPPSIDLLPALPAAASSGEAGGNTGDDASSSCSDDEVSGEAFAVDINDAAEAVQDKNYIAKTLKLKVSENVQYHPILSLMTSRELYHLADDDVLDECLKWKWHIVRWAYYLCILYHLVFLASITFLTLLVHPRYFKQHNHWRTMCYSLTLILSIVGVSPFLYDIAAGMNYVRLAWKLKETMVRRKGRPVGMQGNDAAWKELRTREKYAVPGEVQCLWAQIKAAFPLSAFDYCSLLSFVLLMGFFVLEGASDYKPTYPNPPDVNATAADNDTTNATWGENATAPPLGKPDVPTPTFVVVLGMACMFAWISTLTFAPVHPRVGNVVTMMSRCLYSDVLPFLLVFIFLLGASAVAVYSLLHDGYSLPIVLDILKNEVIPTAEAELWFNNGGPGDSGYPGGEGADRRVWVILMYVLLLAFIAIWALLMLNLFIAAMTSTYEEVKTRAQQEWKLQWGRDVLLLERRLYLVPYFGDRLRMNHGDKNQHVQLSISKFDASAALSQGFEKHAARSAGASAPPSPTDGNLAAIAAGNLGAIKSRRKK